MQTTTNRGVYFRVKHFKTSTNNTHDSPTTRSFTFQFNMPCWQEIGLKLVYSLLSIKWCPHIVTMIKIYITFTSPTAHICGVNYSLVFFPIEINSSLITLVNQQIVLLLANFGLGERPSKRR